MAHHGAEPFSAWSAISNHHQPIKLDDSISIGIAAYGNAEATRRCLEALFRCAEGNFELILINDNSPDNGQTATLYTWASSIHSPTITYETKGHNIEYSGSVDLILTHARGDKILFISNDIFITPYYLKALLAASLSLPNWGILRGSSNFIDNGLASHNIPTSKPVENLEDIFTESQNIYALFSDLHIPDPFLTGDAFMVNREVVNKIGVFDPLFYGYFADHDYGIRAKIAGFQTMLIPGAYAYHQAGSNITYLSAEEQARKISFRWARVHENWARFKLKYGIAVQTTYISMHDIEWDRLCSALFNPKEHHINPKNYESLRIS